MIWLWGALKTRLGQAVALVLAVLALMGLQRAKGRKEGAERVSRRAQIAAEAREGKRDEIDDDAGLGDAVKRLQRDWSRD